MPKHELIAAAAVGVAALLVLGLSELLRRFGASKEVSRKSAHIGSGLLACSFPWAFESPLTVTVLCGGFGGLVLAAKHFGQLQGVHGVERESHGAVLFPVIIALLFWMTAGDPLLFSVPILVLTVSDAVAALIGKGYGAFHYKALGEQRSFEGSLAFFIVTFVAVHVPLLLTEQTTRLDSVLIAVLIAVLATCVEAISVRGLDNLFIPMIVAYGLANFLSYSSEEIADRSLALVAFGAFCILARRLGHLTHTGAIAGFLVLYAAFSLGSLPFALPMLGFFSAIFTLAFLLSRQAPVEPIGLSRVVQAMVVEAFLIMTWENNPTNALYLAYLAALSGTSALVMGRLGGQLGALKGVGSTSTLFAGVFGAAIPSAIGAQYLVDSMGRSALIAWLGGVFCLALVAILRLTTARFHCEDCGLRGGEPRHCGTPNRLESGHRYWTANRAAMTSIAGVAAVVWGVGGALGVG